MGGLHFSIWETDRSANILLRSDKITLRVHLSFSDVSNIPKVHFMDQGNDISIPRQQTEVAPHKYKIGEYKYENTKTGIQIQKEEILITSYGSGK